MHTENQLPRLPGSALKVPGGVVVVASYPLSSQAPTPVEVELGCDNLCDFQSNILINMYEHKFNAHPDIPLEFHPQSNNAKDFVLNLLAEQNMELMEEVETIKKGFEVDLENLKRGIEGSFKELAGAIKESIDNLEEGTKSGFLNMYTKIENIEQKVCGKSNVHSASPSIPAPELPPSSAAKTQCPPNNPRPRPATTDNISGAPPPTRKRKSKYLSKPKVLYIGDSIAHNAEFGNLEFATNSRIRTMKAYSSAYDVKAKFPKKNVTDITRSALCDTQENDAYSELVLSAPTVDITNLDTSKLTPAHNTEVYKQSVVMSCRNIFTAAENALRSSSKLSKVMILEHPPRFDLPEVDPLGLKPQLANYANMMFAQLWLASPLKEKINIGRHNLDCSQDKFIEKFMDERTNKFDGVHMYGWNGRQAYTSSLIHIMKSAMSSKPSAPDHKSCPQSRYQKSSKKTTFSQQPQSNYYSVPVKNKFDILGN